MPSDGRINSDIGGVERGFAVAEFQGFYVLGVSEDFPTAIAMENTRTYSRDQPLAFEMHVR